MVATNNHICLYVENNGFVKDEELSSVSQLKMFKKHKRDSSSIAIENFELCNLQYLLPVFVAICFGKLRIIVERAIAALFALPGIFFCSYDQFWTDMLCKNFSIKVNTLL